MADYFCGRIFAREKYEQLVAQLRPTTLGKNLEQLLAELLQIPVTNITANLAMKDLDVCYGDRATV